MSDKLTKEKPKVTYQDGLDVVTKARYREKLKLIDNKDPYLIPKKEWSKDRKELPELQYPDIVNYLVNTVSAYTLNDMKAYKSLEAYNQMVCGWVKEIGLKNFAQNCLVSGRAMHSQRMNETPLHSWLIAEKGGNVLTAHCNCMAGLGETCSHVGALLFAIEATLKLTKSQTVTQEKSYWLLPSAVQKVEGKPVKAIDFTSAKLKKKQLDTAISDSASGTPLPNKPQKIVQNIPQPSEMELSNFFKGIHETGTKPVLLSLIPEFANFYKPTALDKKFPLVLSEVRDENFISVKKDTLLSHCEEIFDTLKISEEEAKNVEEATKEQAQCREWHRFRTGRITASKMKSVCHTSILKPAQSLIKSICYPSTVKFSNKATRWGCDHEKTAQKEYVERMKENHDNFEFRDSGLVSNPKYPYLGASPDGIGNCNCCGEVCIEIKCPYCKRDVQLEASLDKKDCLEKQDGKLTLKKLHPYYYQVQCQLLVCEKEYCDFIVWTEVDFHAERIVGVDSEFCSKILNQSKLYFLNAILPELVGKLFSKPSLDIVNTVNVSTSDINASACAPSSTTSMPLMETSMRNDTSNDTSEALQTICTCQTTYNPDADDVIGCDNENCPFKWFHFKCVKIRRVPKGKWICPTCRKISKK